VLDRPYRDRGVPPRFFRYDFPFLRWLEKTRREPDIYADDDLDAFPSGDELRKEYDLVVFPGHSEYMTQRAYDLVERYRDLGGRLVFLSANNFFWKVEKRGQSLRRVAQWRTLKRPEVRLLGVQYRANDDGRRQGPFFIPDVSVAPWLFEGTGLEDGDTLGEEVGGFGIEIDTTTTLSPPGTKVLDNTLIYVMSEIGDGQDHTRVSEILYPQTPDYLPLLTIGKAGGALKSGQVVQFPIDVKDKAPMVNRPAADIYLTMARAMGAPTSVTFPGQTGVLPGVLA